jgi:hypothetical protein
MEKSVSISLFLYGTVACKVRSYHEEEKVRLIKKGGKKGKEEEKKN